MAENQSNHRQKIEALVINSNIRHEELGMWFAFIITMAVMGSGIYLLMHNKQVIGFIAFFAPAVFQAGNYIYNKYAEHKHATNKQGSNAELKQKTK